MYICIATTERNQANKLKAQEVIILDQQGNDFIRIQAHWISSLFLLVLTLYPKTLPVLAEEYPAKPQAGRHCISSVKLSRRKMPPVLSISKYRMDSILFSPFTTKMMRVEDMTLFCVRSSHIITCFHRHRHHHHSCLWPHDQSVLSQLSKVRYIYIYSRISILMIHYSKLLATSLVSYVCMLAVS